MSLHLIFLVVKLFTKNLSRTSTYRGLRIYQIDSSAFIPIINLVLDSEGDFDSI